MKDKLEFHFPSEIQLNNNPLLEAWLEIRWQLERGDMSDLAKDPGFPFALGTFYKNVRDRFNHQKPLSASRAPEDMLPYVVRYQFRPEEDKSPILQLGPGVASVNFTDVYTWNDFKEEALYLRENLLDAYGDMKLETQMVILRYRNGVPFDCNSNDLLHFFAQNLNTSLTLPNYIPGSVSPNIWPTRANIIMNFDLLEPRGIGTLQLATGGRQRKDSETDQQMQEKMLIWQLGVESKDNDAPNLNKENEFTRWLESAHAVIHEWFFSLIDNGPLFDKYTSEVE